jgi:molecular chaperone DnaK
MAGDDKDDIEHKTQALEQASTALMQRMYEQQQSAAGGGGAGSTGGSGGSAPGGKQDDVLDAEFEEVKESDRKKA